MSHSSYSSSERRGILAVALISLLILAGAGFMSVCGRQTSLEEGQVIEYPEMTDSVFMNSKKEGDTKSKKEKAKKSSTKKSKQNKSYRRRSPRDENV